MYYALACAGGDPYACRAGEVARRDGLLSEITNDRLAKSIVDNLSEEMCREDKVETLLDKMERIRADLAKSHSDLLQGATPRNPRQLDRQQISDFHNNVFDKHGAGRVFGGDTWDRWLGWTGDTFYDWCPSPSCRR